MFSFLFLLCNTLPSPFFPQAVFMNGVSIPKPSTLPTSLSVYGPGGERKEERERKRAQNGKDPKVTRAAQIEEDCSEQLHKGFGAKFLSKFGGHVKGLALLTIPLPSFSLILSHSLSFSFSLCVNVRACVCVCVRLCVCVFVCVFVYRLSSFAPTTTSTFTPRSMHLFCATIFVVSFPLSSLLFSRE